MKIRDILQSSKGLVICSSEYYLSLLFSVWLDCQKKLFLFLQSSQTVKIFLAGSYLIKVIWVEILVKKPKKLVKMKIRFWFQVSI